jgi:hypothetical protein
MERVLERWRRVDVPKGRGCTRPDGRVDRLLATRANVWQKAVEDMNSVYEAWNTALADRYFSASEAGKPVYLSVDDDALDELLPEVRDAGPAADALAAVVRGTLRPGDDSFVGHLVKRTEWRRNGLVGPPPYIALLALCVLAASRMARDPLKGITRTAYYPQLNPLLQRPQFEGMPPGFDQVDDLWNDLRRWLDEDLESARGTSTASTHPFFTHIGWPISQCLLREADRRRLTEFFRSVGLEPHAEIESTQLWTLFLNWAREGCGLSDQALRVVHTARPEVAEQISEIIKREFDVWEGELRDAQGRRRGEIALVLEVSQGGRRIAARLVPRRPDGFPEHGRWRLNSGAEIDLQSAAEDWYQPLTLEPDRAVLSGGLSMTYDGLALAYDAGSVVPLRATLGLGAWASVRQATALEEHCILTAEALLPRVREFLARYADGDWRVLDRTGNLPAGWRVVERVRITRSVPEVADELQRLAPRLHTATRLEGGLQVAPRQYLTRGEPDLWITVERGEQAEIELDERRIGVSDGVLEVRLAELDPPLGPGEHEIFAGGIRRHFTTFGGFPLVAPAGAGSLGHVFERHGTYRPSSVDAEPLPRGGPPRGQVYVCGASAQALPEDLPEPVQPPALVPVGLRAYTILGARHGDLLSLVPSKQPRWLNEIGLVGQCQFFDQPVPFEAEWLVTEGKLGLRVRPLRMPPAEPQSEQLDARRPPPSDGAVGAWREAIKSVAEAGARPRVCGEIWDRYVSVAQ